MNDTILDKQIKYWEDQLLDLGKRNRMISYRPTRRSTLNILTPTMEELYRQVITQERELTFQRPITRDTDPRMYSVLTLLDSLSRPMEVAIGDIRGEGPLTETARTLKNLRSRAKLAMDEQGTNILYLVFGFVEWREKPGRSDTWLRSPLLLAPVTLQQPTLNNHFTLKRQEDEIVVNPTLSYLFSRDYGVQLPEFDADRDSLEEYFQKMEALAEEKGWRILRQSSLGLVSFLKINMYNDLVRNESQLRSSPILRALAGERNAISDPDRSGWNFDHDAVRSVEGYQVLNADSSQQDAIALSRQGVSFVMQGPPGTGKSQTIANIIGQALADGKKILFVSEKMAALDVVFKRLADVGLADFCLSLHSHKANKREVLRQLEANLDMKRLRLTDEELAQLTRLDMVRKTLQDYVRELHEPRGALGISLYEACAAAAQRQNLEDIALHFAGLENMNRDELNRLAFQIQKLDRSRQALGEYWRESPWEGFLGPYLSDSEKLQLKNTLRRLLDALEGLDANFLESLTLDEIENVLQLSEEARQCAALDGKWYYTPSQEPLGLLRALEDARKALQDLHLDLVRQFGRGAEDLPGENLEERFRACWPQVCALAGESREPTVSGLESLAGYLKEYLKVTGELERFRRRFCEAYGVSLPEGCEEELVRLCRLSLDMGPMPEGFRDEADFAAIRELSQLLEQASRDAAEAYRHISAHYDPAVLELPNAEEILEQRNRDESALNWLEGHCEAGMDFLAQLDGGLWKKTAGALKDPVFARMNAYCAVSRPNTLRQLSLQRRALNGVVQTEIPESWKTARGREKVKTIIGKALETYRDIHSRQALLQPWLAQQGIVMDAASITAEDAAWLQSAGEIPAEADKLLEAVNSTRSWEILDIIDETAGRLCADRLKWKACTENAGFRNPEQALTEKTWQDTYLLAEGCAPETCWAGGSAAAYALLDKAEKLCRELGELYQGITRVCERSVFEIDYAGILNRFKTEYISRLKFLKRSYHADMKTMRLCFREIREEIPENEVIRILMDLRIYDEKLEAYHELFPELEKWFAVSSADIFWPWHRVRNRLEVFYTFAQLFDRESDAVSFLRQDGWTEGARLLRRMARDAQWLEKNDSAERFFGHLYRGEKTDTGKIREQMSRMQRILVRFSSEEACLKFLNSFRRKEFSRMLQACEALAADQNWLRQAQGELAEALPGLTGITVEAVRNAGKVLDAYTLAAQVLGEAGARCAFRETECWREYRAALNALEPLEECVRELCGNKEIPGSVMDMNLDAMLVKLEQAREAALRWHKASKLLQTFCLEPGYCPAMADLQAIRHWRRAAQLLQTNADRARQLLGDAFRGRDTDWEKIRGMVHYRQSMGKLMGEQRNGSLAGNLENGGMLWDMGQTLTQTENLRTLEQLKDACPQLRVPENSAGARTLQEALDFVRQTVFTLTGSKNQPIRPERCLEGLALLDRRNEYRREIARLEEALEEVLPELAGKQAWDRAEAMFAHLENVKMAIYSGSLAPGLVEWVLSGDAAREESEIRGRLSRIQNLEGELRKFLELFAGNRDLCRMNLRAIGSKVSACFYGLDSLDLWIDLRRVQGECAQLGLGNFVSESARLDYPDGKLMDMFLKAFYREWFEQLSRNVPEVAGFRVHNHIRTIADFRELDDHQLPVDQMRIREKLALQMPSAQNQARAADEMSILLHELGKKRNIMALRKLFRAIPNLLLRLKPCLMMSPLSVAHFLEAETYRFDMVIFDEASQIFPQDAIGAIFRGKQVIIAGDSNQLPPTNFFSASTNNDPDGEEYEEEGCFDSILEAAALTLPNRSLLWHYRSRYEELIAFPNREIYGGHLITFPSSALGQPDTGVEYVYVENGIYDNRCNRAEAARIVELVKRHIELHPDRSLGIIAFSESQQSIIEEEILKFRLENPRHEPFFDENSEEPFFVKNLENVQGDERDTIIFSVCYGKNPQGRMYMRFGPLGHTGGERRLNVAITRAKRNVKLVGSILPQDIDLNKTQAEGVKMLRDYIAFAMGTKTGNPSNCAQRQDTDRFALQVGSFLEERGCRIRMHHGNSEYTVDIAVEHPGKPGQFLAAVECDGNTYHMARTVRDRDHLRAGVMENMGWKLHRVWSVEWLRNPEGERRRLLDFLEEALLHHGEAGSAVREKDGRQDVQTREVLPGEDGFACDPDNPYGLELYREGNWQDAMISGPMNEELLLAQRILAVVTVEQPVHLEVLSRRLAESFGVTKATQNVRDAIEGALRDHLSQDVVVCDQFVSLSQAAIPQPRRSLPGQPHRAIEHISIPEIAGAMEKVLEGSFGMETTVLCQETARIFGYERMGNKLRTRTREAVEYLRSAGKISVINDKVQRMEMK